MKQGHFKRVLRALVPIDCETCGHQRGVRTETGTVTCEICGERQ